MFGSFDFLQFASESLLWLMGFGFRISDENGSWDLLKDCWPFTSSSTEYLSVGLLSVFFGLFVFLLLKVHTLYPDKILQYPLSGFY